MKYYDYKYRVRYGDTDKLGITYYANYLVWYEAARTEYFRALGLPYTECEKKGYFLPVVQAGIHYIATSTYDDLVTVRTSVSEIKRTSMKFEYEVFNGSASVPINTGFTTHVFVDKNMRPVRVPDEVQKIVTLHPLLKK